MALSPSWCVLCRKDNESIDHLLIHCEIATKLLNQLFYEASLSWVVQDKSSALFVEEMVDFGSNKMARALWNSMIVALIWSIWMERNDRIFSDKESHPQDLFERAKYLASVWASTDKSFRGFPLSLIVNNWRDIRGP